MSQVSFFESRPKPHGEGIILTFIWGSQGSKTSPCAGTIGLRFCVFWEQLQDLHPEPGFPQSAAPGCTLGLQAALYILDPLAFLLLTFRIHLCLACFTSWHHASLPFKPSLPSRFCELAYLLPKARVTWPRVKATPERQLTSHLLIEYLSPIKLLSLLGQGL